MKHETTVVCLSIVFVVCAGCSGRTPATVAVGISSSTTDQVCAITAKQLNVARSKISAETSLGDLGADELDFVELVMELEEHFDIAVPDETAERMMGTDNWQQGMKNVTMAKLASLVDDQKRLSHTSGAPPPRTTEHRPELSKPSKTLPPQDGTQPSQVKVFLNPLVMLLAGAEKQKGQPLTREEVLEIRDSAAFIMMSPDSARKFYSSLDAQTPVHRMDPDRIWEEWQEIRGQLK